MTTLNFTLTVEGLESNTFVVREFKGQESISQLEYDQGKLCNGYNFDVQLASRSARVSAEDVVDKSVELSIYRNQEQVQTISGIVRSFSKGDTGHHHTFYALTLVPALERLSLRHNSRIFQLKTVPEIISILLKEMDIEDYAFSLQREYAQREFCVQYRETDLDFLHRLAAEEGLIYSFSFEKNKHTVIFSDASANLLSLPSQIPYNTLSGGQADTCYISAVNAVTTSQPSQSALKDYSFKQPAYDFQQDASGTDLDYQRQEYEHFDAPGRFKSDQAGNSINQVRLEYLRRDSHVATGNSDVPYLQAGIKFSLEEHLGKELNREWLVVSVQHQGTQPQALEEEAGSGATTYSNKFKVIPSQYNWQPEPSLKPLISGPMIALVVGPEGEEIYCDEFGRVKIQFPWDRYSQGDEHSSCWVRVSQGWAGSQYGIMAIPRIGHEVIVEFLNGDPDQPIITGRAYHATNTPPYSLPEHKTKTVLRSATHQGEGYNELSFEDQSQNEQIFIHAQKDWDSEINNDHTEHVKHDQHVVIENDEFERVQNNTNQTVEGESRSQVTQDKTLIVEGSLHVKTGSVWVNDSGSEVHVKAGNKVVIEAGSEITLNAAGSFLKVDPAGVHLVGAGVNLNSGGSAGSGSGYSGQVAELPNTLTNEIVVGELEKNSVAASQQNANSNVITEFSAPDEVVYESQSSSPNNSAPTVAPSSSTSKSSGETESEPQSDDDKALRLKSPLLKQSLTLDKLANRESHAYKSSSSGQEVEYIQQALIKLGFDLGNAGADGDFGPTTKRQIELFQKEYKATNKTHLAYEVGSADGIVGQGTLLGLDEALVEGWQYQKSVESVLVTYKDNLPANKRVVSQKSIEIIKLAFSKAGAKQAVITSTLRTPEEQAKIMYRNANHDLASQFRLYGQVGDMVLTVYKENQNAKNVVELMTTEIENLLEKGKKVSKHCTTFEEYKKVNIIDLGVNSMLNVNGHKRSLISKISSQFRTMEKEGILKFIDETNKSNKCWHIEVNIEEL